MLNTEVLSRLEALIAYGLAQADGEADWQMLVSILAAVRGAACDGPELQGLYEHIDPYINERL